MCQGFQQKRPGGSACGVTIAQDAISLIVEPFKRAVHSSVTTFAPGRTIKGTSARPIVHHLAMAVCHPARDRRQIFRHRKLVVSPEYLFGFIIFGVLSWTLEDVYLADGSRQ